MVFGVSFAPGVFRYCCLLLPLSSVTVVFRYWTSCVPILKDSAQVLRVFEQGNSSQVVVFLGRRYGQMRVLAKGSRNLPRKGFEGGFDLLMRGELLVYPRRDEGLWLFKEWDEHLRWEHRGRSWEALRGGSFLCELTEALTRESAGASPHSADDASNAALYDHLADAADALAQGMEPGPRLFCFTLRVLETLGLLPELSRCSRCGAAWSSAGASAGASSRADARILARLGVAGLECKKCVAQEPPDAAVGLTLEALRALAFVKRTGKGVRLSATAAQALARAFQGLVHGALEHDLRTLPWTARQVLRMGEGKHV